MKLLNPFNLIHIMKDQNTFLILKYLKNINNSIITHFSNNFQKVKKNKSKLN